MKQSELHVIYLWARQETFGKQLPLPCEVKNAVCGTVD